MRKISRLGLIGDVHGEHLALRSALAFLSHQSLDAIACVGDLVDGTGDVDDVCDQLQRASVDTVRGNHDRWLLAGEHRDWPNATPHVAATTRAFLETLPSTIEYASDCGTMMIAHGIGDDDTAECRFDTALEHTPALDELLTRPDLRLHIGGHTHRPMVRHLPRDHVVDALAIINVGTLRHTRPRRVVVVDVDPPPHWPPRWQHPDPDPTEPPIPVTLPTSPRPDRCVAVTFYRQVGGHRFSVECRGLA